MLYVYVYVCILNAKRESRTHSVWGDDLTLAPSEMPRQPTYDEM